MVILLAETSPAKLAQKVSFLAYVHVLEEEKSGKVVDGWEPVGHPYTDGQRHFMMMGRHLDDGQLSKDMVEDELDEVKYAKKLLKQRFIL